MTLEPADETLGRYRLFARLGRGGMAELHVARMSGAAGVEKFVVIKRMLRHLASDPQFVAMFENEGRIAVRLDHPNVCQAYELDTVDGQLFLAMELVRGMPWSTVAARLPSDEVATCRFIVGVMMQACEGLHYAHHLTDASGNLTPVVHRDVSPGNLMITNDGAIKLLDFGVSKLLTDSDATRAGMIKGKLPYMAPEHIRGAPVDSRADIFSLGVVMWEALARRSLFERPSDLQIFKAIVEDEVPPLPQTPIIQRLEVVLRRALARDRADRQTSARQLADELREALAPSHTPMTQAQIQGAMSDWLRVELANSQQDLAAAISRLRSGDVRREPDREATRTSIDFMVGRAAETQIGSLPDAEADTEDEAPTARADEDEAPTVRAPTTDDDEAPTRTPHKKPVVRMESEPSLTTVAPTAPRAVVTRAPRPVVAPTAPRAMAPSPVVTPVFDETAEPSETHPTAPRPLPFRAVSEEALTATQPRRLPTPSVQPQSWPTPMPGPALGSNGNARFWILVVAVLSVLVGVFVALVSS